LTGAFETIHYTLDEKAVYRSRFNKAWPTTGPEAAALLTAKVAEGGLSPWKRQEAERALARVEEIKAELASVREAAGEFEAEWEDLRWARFFLVTNNNGHIHSSMNCSTCFPTTQFGWLPALSGLTEKEAVESQGTILCSVCFPSAPVEWTVGKQVDESLYCEASGKYAGEYVEEGERLYHSKGPDGERVEGKIRPSGRAYYWVGECPGGCGTRSVTVNEKTLKIRKHKKG
jgi:hypothetical protein